MRLQSARVEDVAEAIAQLASGAGAPQACLFELGGPRVYSYTELVEEIARLLGAVRKGKLVLSSELAFCGKTSAIEDRFGAIVLKKSASRLFPEFSIKTNGYLRYAFAVADRSISISVPPAWMYSTSLILGGLVAVLR